jgi:hypothetical protein
MPNRPRKHDRKIEEAARKRYERLVRQWEDIRRLYLAGADLRHINTESPKPYAASSPGGFHSERSQANRPRVTSSRPEEKDSANEAIPS